MVMDSIGTDGDWQVRQTSQTSIPEKGLGDEEQTRKIFAHKLCPWVKTIAYASKSK